MQVAHSPWAVDLVVILLSGTSEEIPLGALVVQAYLRDGDVSAICLPARKLRSAERKLIEGSTDQDWYLFA